MAAAAIFAVATLAADYQLASGDVKAVISGQGTLESVAFGGFSVDVMGDGWSVKIADGTQLGPSGCGSVEVVLIGKTGLTVMHFCGDYQVNATYEITTGSYLVKNLALTNNAKAYNVTSAEIYAGTQFTGLQSFTTQINAFYAIQIAGFGRFAGSDGLFFSLMTPFGTHQASGQNVTVSYAGNTNHRTAHVGIDGVVMGHAVHGGYMNPGTNIYKSEATAFKACVDSFRMVPQTTAVKVNVAWDENDYQLDMASPQDVAEYKRIIDMNADLGLTYQIFAARNSKHSSRYNTTDGWGFEDVLWLSMGELIREGKFNPVTDPIASDITDIVQYASMRGVKLLAYVYPCLGFVPMKQYFVAPSGNMLDISPPEVREWLIETLDAFYVKSGVGGFAWDHGIVAGNNDLHYSQWRAWAAIRTELTRRHPDIVFDNRQVAHFWGPWYMLHPGYQEPIAGDENPETYGVPFPSFHTDIVTAGKMRSVNYLYSSSSLLAASMVPGFISHQTERSADNQTVPCEGASPCYGVNQRDFDYLGYKFSLLSTVGTAGANLVWAMMPARDTQEYEFLPQKDKDFIAGWLTFADTNLMYLKNTDNIATLEPPAISKVDGTHAMYKGEGYLFLFNQNYDDIGVALTIDSSMGLPNDTSITYTVQEMNPQARVVGQWKGGQQVSVTVTGKTVTVLHLTRATSQPKVMGAALEGSKLVGFKGHTQVVVLRDEAEKVNGVQCESQRESEHGTGVAVDVVFGGDYLSTSMPLRKVAQGGGWFNYTTSVTVGMKQQLENRAVEYPIQWVKPKDYEATWLVPTRLPLYFFSSRPSSAAPLVVYINGNKVPLTAGYTSRGIPRTNTFLGWWFDATAYLAQPTASLSVAVDASADSYFIGAYWENIVPESTSEVRRC
eukprot:TRINITY_DN1488_c0_g1_i1.p1 TRINITY_DN1488_c0_g1~~TRINITY_DN1488_c0_g1_i1.p1  ORF type:complete len:894 (+),score=220.21 TRINITY_DN1488_c0_g1_i1:47-2728(+)